MRPTVRNICAVVAVIQQETGFQVDPVVPGLPDMARREIDERAARHHIPKTLVTLALGVRSPNGLSYAERLRQARTERALSEMFEDFIATVPLGRRLFADLNPVRTGGPMQVGIAFAESHVRTRNYPFPLTDGVRREVFTRRGGLYFGIAHLLDYPVSYDSMLYRFADFNAGHYASRNAAFQKAVSSLSKTRLAIDGDLLREGSSEPSQTELAVRMLADRIGLGRATDPPRPRTRKNTRVRGDRPLSKGLRAGRRTRAGTACPGTEHTSGKRKNYPQSDYRVVRTAGGQSLSPLSAEFGARALRDGPDPPDGSAVFIRPRDVGRRGL